MPSRSTIAVVLAAQLHHPHRNGQTHVSVSLVDPADRHPGLAERDAAVVGRRLPRLEHAQPRVAQALHQQRRQQRIQEAAAAEAPRCAGRCDSAACCTQRASPSAMAWWNSAAPRAASPSSARRAISGARVERAVGRMRAPASLSSAPCASGSADAGQRLEQHRRLALVGAGLAHAAAAPAAASNQRPMLVVGGQRSSRASICATAAAAGRWPKRASICAPRPMRCSAAAAMRQGSRAAASPPGMAIGARWPSRWKAAPSTLQQLAAPGARRRRPGRCRRAPGRAAGRRRRARPRPPRRAHGGAAPHAPAATRCGGELEREAGAEEVGVQVVRDGLRPHVEHRAQVLDHLDQRVAGGGVVEVADMRRQEGLVAARDADVFFSQAPVASTGGPARGSLIGHGRVAARTADELRRRRGAAGAARCRRSARRCRGRASARVGDAVEPRQRLVVADHQRLAAGVGAGHHEQQVLRLLQPAAAARAGPPPRGTAGTGSACTAASRPARCRPGATPASAIGAGPRASAAARSAARAACSSACSAAPACTQRTAEARFAAITAKGFSSRCLRWRRRATALGVAGVAGEVEAAQALDGDDAAVAQQRQRGGDRIAGDRPARAHRPARSAGPHTGQALGSAWKRRSQRIGVLAQARRALRERRHAGLRAVVGQGAGQRVARAALGAVDEGVAVAAVGRVEQLGQAVVAGGGVGRDRWSSPRPSGWRRMRKPGIGVERRRAAASSASTRASGGASLFSRCSKRCSACAGPCDLDGHALRVVEDPAGQAQLAAPGDRRRAGSPRPARRRARGSRGVRRRLGVGQHGTVRSRRLQPRDLRLELGHAALQRRHLVQALLARRARAALDPGQPGVHARRRWWPRPGGSRSPG